MLIDDLRSVVGERHVLDTDIVGYTTDWTGRFVGATAAVVMPGSTAEVAAVVKVLRRHGRPLVPQGGNTGLVGGGVPMHDEIVLSLRRMNRVLSIDPQARQIAVQAGVTLESTQVAASEAGLRYPVDFAARGTATIGGSIATNAGGINVLRYGSTRQQVIGLEAVLADGSMVSTMAGLMKDNTGYDLRGLLCGSEGTLGIITAAVLRLVPNFEHVTTALLGCSDLDRAMEVVAALLRANDGVDAVEIMSDRGVDLVQSVFDVAPPFRSPWYVLVEMSAMQDCGPVLNDIVASCEALHSAVADGENQRARLWRLREDHTLAIATLGTALKYDITVPLRDLPSFVARVSGLVSEVSSSAETIIFGHAADGNLHVNVVGALPKDHVRVDETVLRAVASVGGSISAEHGVGLAKRDWLHLTRTPDEISAMRAIKTALDPAGMLNPRVLFPD